MKTHVIIGASSGIRQQLAKMLAEAGDRVIGNFNKTEPKFEHPNISYHQFDVLDSEDKIKANADRHPLKKIGNIEDIAGMAAYLLSDQAAWITGQVMHVDGGMSAIKG